MVNKRDDLEHILQTKLQENTTQDLDLKILRKVSSLQEQRRGETVFTMRRFSYVLSAIVLTILIWRGPVTQTSSEHGLKSELASVIMNEELLENMELLSLVDDIELTEQEWEILLNESHI